MKSVIYSYIWSGFNLYGMTFSVETLNSYPSQDVVDIDGLTLSYYRQVGYFRLLFLKINWNCGNVDSIIGITHYSETVNLDGCPQYFVGLQALSFVKILPFSTNWQLVYDGHFYSRRGKLQTNRQVIYLRLIHSYLCSNISLTGNQLLYKKGPLII